MWTVEQYLGGVTPPEPRQASCPPPEFNPLPWNSDDIVNLANCYAYALNFVPGEKNWFPVPGERAPFKRSPTLSMLFNNALSDGLIRAPCHNPPAVKGYYLVALFESATGPAWHWYRQDRDGLWSHKPGYRNATRFDAKGQIITDPCSAARPYSLSEFVSFFYVPNEGLSFPDLQRRKLPEPGRLEPFNSV